MVFVGPTAPLTWMQILRSCHPPILPEIAHSGRVTDCGFATPTVLPRTW